MNTHSIQSDDLSYFYTNLTKENHNLNQLIEDLKRFSLEASTNVYVVNRPLKGSENDIKDDAGIFILIPKKKICFIKFNNCTPDDFQDYIEEIIEELNFLSMKYKYRAEIGRPKEWRNLICEFDSSVLIKDLLEKSTLVNPVDKRKSELLLSLLIGSVNDISIVGLEVPQSNLDIVKKKIILFDAEQTRFIFEDNGKTNPVRIQGLSGTGKTELLLHKLKELYIQSNDSKIAFTCFNKILATKLKERIPDFFDFMKVEQQIQWDKRLFCYHAWGSIRNPLSGMYRYICHHYEVDFHTFSKAIPFKNLCLGAIKQISDKIHTLEASSKYAFDYCLIDESQDFPEEFFELCRLVTKTKVYIAGDIFQTIFSDDILSDQKPHYLLNRCYRTDPKTLMFAHSLGLGLFEDIKLRWLNDREWSACGYEIQREQPPMLKLTRKPVTRFEDVDIQPIFLNYYSEENEIVTGVINVINNIFTQNNTAKPEDICIVIIDGGNRLYNLANIIQEKVRSELQLDVNKGYESKDPLIKNSILITNRNNVKGLEFPFLICICFDLNRLFSHRNSLYMSLTRSYLQSFLFMPLNDYVQKMKTNFDAGLDQLISLGHINTKQPTDKEIEELDNYKQLHIAETKSLEDILGKIFVEEKIPEEQQNTLREHVLITFKGTEVFDYDKIKEYILAQLELQYSFPWG